MTTDTQTQAQVWKHFSVIVDLAKRGEFESSPYSYDKATPKTLKDAKKNFESIAEWANSGVMWCDSRGGRL